MKDESGKNKLFPEDESLQNFRQFAKSHIDSFIAAKDRIFRLLGPSQNLPSGIYREALLKEFFRSLLPSDVSVDSGFIYSFDVIPSSGQLDIIIWHSAKHSPVYRSQDFVIVPPESVISVISVKSRLDNEDLRSGLDNLLTVTPIELRFREFAPVQGNYLRFPPITKFLVTYESERPFQNILSFVSNYYKSKFEMNLELGNALIAAFSRIVLQDPQQGVLFLIGRLMPRMIATVKDDGLSFFFGLGPPDDPFGEHQFGPGLRRLPYLYRQENKITTAFEKLCSEVLHAVYRGIGTTDWPTISAWMHIDPVKGITARDAYEIEESTGVPLVDPNKIGL